MPREIVDEIRSGYDGLADWLSDREQLDAMLLEEQVDVAALRRVIDLGYAPDLDDTEVVRMGNDPFLISYGLMDTASRIVVTTGVSKPGKQRANRHVPDVCRSLGVTSINSFELLRTLDFTTSWRLRL